MDDDKQPDKKLIEKLEDFYSISLQFLNRYDKSSKLQNFFSDAIESLFYANLIKNFFSNLTEENIEEYKLSDKEVKKLKKEFKEIRDEIEFGLSFSLEVKIDESYYNKFKNEIKNNFSDFCKLIVELEKLIDIDNIKKLIEEKKEEIKKSGKRNPIINDFLVTAAIEEYIDKNKEMPDLNNPKILNDIVKQSPQKFTQKVMDKYSGMKITNWNIWHSFATYFLEEFNNLEEIAVKLVKTDLCPVVISSQGQIWWKEYKPKQYWWNEDKQVKTGKLEVKYSKDGKLTYKFPNISDKYVIEVLTQGIDMMHSESHAFNQKYLNSFQYIRGFLGTCRLKKDKRTISLYPQIKLYNNGVLNIFFREIGPKGFEYYINSFIENELNLSRLGLDNIEVPPALLQLNNIFHYNRMLSLSKKTKDFINGKSVLKRANEKVESETRIVKEGDFSYKLAPLKIENEPLKLYLNSLYEGIISALDVIINYNYDNFIKNHSKYTWGDFFAFRPSVYILEFIDQPDSSYDIINNFSNELGKLMARQYQPYHIDFSKFMGENLREFDDYCLFINKALTLWIYSKNGIRIYNDPDPNGGRIIYQHQVQVEAINHLFMSHKRLLEISLLLTIPYKSVIKEQSELIILEELLTEEIGKYGEINKWYNEAEKVLNWKKTRNLIEKNLKMRSQYYSEKRNNLFRNFGLIISILFGFFGTALFALNVTKPLWKYSGFKLNLIPASLSDAVFILVTGLFAIITLLILYGFMTWWNKNH